MPNLNQCTFIGHLTRDSETRFLANNTPVTNGGIAITTTWAKDKERTCFLDFVIFGPRAEAFAKYTAKGAPVCLVGELEYQTWEKDGQKRSKHILRVNEFQFLGNKHDPAPSRPQPQPPKQSSGQDDLNDPPPF